MLKHQKACFFNTHNIYCIKNKNGLTTNFRGGTIMKLTDEKVDLTIQCEDREQHLFSELCKTSRTIKGLLYRRVNKTKLEVAFKTEEAKDAFIVALNAWIANSYIITHILNTAQQTQLSMLSAHGRLDAFFDNQLVMVYLHVLSEKNLRSFLKHNNFLDVEKYYKFNMRAFKDDMEYLLKSQPFEISAIEKEAEILNEDDQLLVDMALELSNTIKLEPINTVHITDDEYEICFIDENKCIYTTLIFPSVMDNIEAIENLSPEKYILFMLMVLRPQKAILHKMSKYPHIEETVENLYNIIADEYPKAFDKIELYFSDDEYTEDEEDDTDGEL